MVHKPLLSRLCSVKMVLEDSCMIALASILSYSNSKPAHLYWIFWILELNALIIWNDDMHCKKRYTNKRALNKIRTGHLTFIPHYHVRPSTPHTIRPCCYLHARRVSLALRLHNSHNPTWSSGRLLPWARRGCCGARSGWWSCCARSPLCGSLPRASRRVHPAGQNPSMPRWGLHPTRSAGERR